MSHARKYGQDLAQLPAIWAGAASLNRGLFFKADRPRPIDPYIDYFGENARSASVLRLEMERAG
jgi:hypothetical protein